MPLLPLSVSGTLIENLDKAKAEATKLEIYVAADKLQAVLQYVKSKQTGNVGEDKNLNDQFLRDTAMVCSHCHILLRCFGQFRNESLSFDVIFFSK
jgi:hypothetical protein